MLYCPFTLVPCHKPYVLPGVVCQSRIVPTKYINQQGNGKKIKYETITIFYWMKKNGQNYTLGTMTELLTTATRIHLSIRTEFHAVNRTVVALQNVPLFSLYTMDPNPFVTCATCHKTILMNRVDRSRRRSIWKGKGMGSMTCVG